MQKSAINQIISHFQAAFQKFGMEVNNAEIESLSLLINQCMLGGRRVFHTPEHILVISQKLSQPAQIFAALFHDIIYFQVDDGFPAQVSELLMSFVEIHHGEVFIKNDIPPEDRSVQICLEIFQFQPGVKLPLYSGLNEFLSAVVAVKKLEKYLNQKQITGVVVCIEGTIPFKEDQDEYNRFEKLENVLRKSNQKFQIGLSEEEIEMYIIQAVTLANQDVENFSDEDVARFLDNTWKLLPETNDTLITANMYSLIAYRKALVKMSSFLNHLQPQYVFHQYRNTPDENSYRQIILRTDCNLKIAREYLIAKITAISIIEALADSTGGGDVPVSMFIGDIRNPDSPIEVERAEDYLPAVDLTPNLNYDKFVLKLLQHGRASQSNFDMQNSPVSYYVYAMAGPEKLQQYMSFAQEFFSQQITAMDFLKKIDPHIVSDLAQACAEVAITRRDALKKFILPNN
ncbi:MAG: hypothetical protein NW226_23495 [Microscillaceae bacterium]|nr:hypothetical protein [Microscillaceae bacterium]